MVTVKFLMEEKEDKIEIEKSPTADTRTCDWSKVTKQELLKSSKMHIKDVIKGNGLVFKRNQSEGKFARS